MTNDTSTLNGALAELGETLADNLVTMGVTDADPSDGLTTLANKVLLVPQGGGSCYHIEFDEASYTAVGGTATVSVYLQSNYAPLSGASVTFSATGISQTATTDNNGIATTTIGNVSSEFTLTATYQNVSDTATILPMVYLMNEDAVTDNSVNVFGDSIALRNNGSNTTGWTDGYYTVKNTGSQKESMRVLKQLNGVTDNFCFEYDSYVEGTNGSSGFVIYNSSTSWEKLTDDADTQKKYWYGYNNGSFHESDFYGNTTTYRKWVHYKYTIQGTTFTMEVTYDNSTVVTHSETIHLTRSSSTKYGLDSEWQLNTQTRYKNLIAYTI